MPPPDKTPDVVLVPIVAIDAMGKAKEKTTFRELSKALGGPLQFSLVAHARAKLGRLDPAAHSYYHPHGHPLHGQERYEWFIADRKPDGTWAALMPATGDEGEEGEILFGFALPDPHAEDPDVAAAIRADLESRKAEARADVERHNARFAPINPEGERDA